MNKDKLDKILSAVLANMPNDWLRLTTHRLDIYNESAAKTQFLAEFEKLLSSYSGDENKLKEDLRNLPTAYDYIRLGHPLSSVLEWGVAQYFKLPNENVISFSSQVMPILAVLRRNALKKMKTTLYLHEDLPVSFDIQTIKDVYHYDFNLVKIKDFNEIKETNGTSILVTSYLKVDEFSDLNTIDFVISIKGNLGAVTLVKTQQDSKEYISDIQHVRRRESIAMTPADCLSAIKRLLGDEDIVDSSKVDTTSLVKTIQKITNTQSKVAIGSSGLSIQYAIVMGLIDDAKKKYPGKEIKLIVPPNCYGGTNDQARRVAAVVPDVEILDLPVDAGHDMVSSTKKVLDEVAKLDAVPLIIAEIPTNPRVEVPELDKLVSTLKEERNIAPVFILDQTFCPNLKFLGESDPFAGTKTISYVSGSKFPSGGLCTAGYCVANKDANNLMEPIKKHLKLCDNEATALQVEILTEHMTTMLERIQKAYLNTRGFVDFISNRLPTAKMNFVSHDLAKEGFTPSVFSLDLPTKGNSPEEKEAYKRELNHKLIQLMINHIPEESKYCVSYGQLKGCYWTIPATSTQGTTKEGDKDYIVRVSVAPEFNLQKHKEIFELFCQENGL